MYLYNNTAVCQNAVWDMRTSSCIIHEVVSFLPPDSKQLLCLRKANSESKTQNGGFGSIPKLKQHSSFPGLWEV